MYIPDVVTPRTFFCETNGCPTMHTSARPHVCVVCVGAVTSMFLLGGVYHRLMEAKPNNISGAFV